MDNNQLIELAERKVKNLTLTMSTFPSTRHELEGELALAKFALSELQERCKSEVEPVAYSQVQRDMMKDVIIRKLGGNLVGERLVMADIHAVTMALMDAGFRTNPPAPLVPPEPTETDIPSWLSGEKGLQWLEGAKWMREACLSAMLQTGDFRENKDSSTKHFRENEETSTNSSVITDGGVKWRAILIGMSNA